MKNQSASYDVWRLFRYFFLSSIIFVVYYIVKKVKRREKYIALLPGMKIPLHDVMAGLRYVRRNESCSLQSSALQAVAGYAKFFEQEKLCCFWLFYHPLVLPLKADVVEKILKDDAIQEKDFTYKQLVPVFGNGLFVSSGEKWKCRRKLLNPCFHQEILKDFMPIFDVQARKLVKHLHEGSDNEIRELYKPLFHCLLNIVFETNMGINADVQGNDAKILIDVYESIKTVFMERVLNWWMWPYFIFRFTKSCKIFNDSLKIANEFTDKALQQKKKQYVKQGPEGNVKKRNSLLSFLLEYHMETGSISEEGIKEEVKSFTSATTDTTTGALTFALYFMGQHKDVQNNLHQEIDRIFGDDKERPVEKEDLIEMKYIDCVLKEAMRLCPPVPMVSRTAAKNTTICGYSIPEGASCVISPYILHRDPAVFPDPEKFDPIRFLPENSENRHPFAYIPFSAGPRNCIGQKFAMMAMKTILSNVLRHFTVESLDNRDKVNFGLDIMLMPDIPLRFRLKRRI